MESGTLLPEVVAFIKAKTKPQVELTHDLRERLRFAELEPMLQSLQSFTGLLNPVEAVEPRNAKEEREKFLLAFKEHGFNTEALDNPRFQYRKYDLDTGEIGRQLVAMCKAIEELENKPLKADEQLGCALAISKIHDDIDTLEIINGLAHDDEARVLQAVRAKYGVVNAGALRLAESAWQKMSASEADASTSTPESHFTAEEQKLLERPLLSAINIAAALYWALTQYNLGEDFDVIVTPEATSIDVRDKNSSGQPTIVVPARYNAPENFYTGKQVLSLLTHEISAHVRQSANGQKLFGFAGGAMKVDNETLYEGLAKANDQSFEIEGFGSATTPLPYAILGLSMIAQGADFKAVFQDNFQRRLQVNPKADKEKTAGMAYTSTQRLFRGCPGFSKDMAYLYGHALVKQLHMIGFDQYVQLGAFGANEITLLARISAPKDDVEKLIPYPHQAELPFVYWEKHLHHLLENKAEEYDRQHEVIKVSSGKKESWWSRFWYRLTNS